MDAKVFFGFNSDNVANLRVWAAFRALGVKRPVYREEKVCLFCGGNYIARSRNQKTCGSQECQNRIILEWQKSNPEKVKKALHLYRRTEKGRQNNLRMHAVRRNKRFGCNVEKWQFALDEIKKSLRKLKYLAIRNAWEYRINHIQKSVGIKREFAPRQPRNVTRMPTRGFHTRASAGWQNALRAVQTTLHQYHLRLFSSVWEESAVKIQAALRAGGKIRLWKI